MSSATAKWAIPYPVSSDAVPSIVTTDQNQANRVDLMLGEAGFITLNNAAATVVNSSIVFGRTYPGNTAGVPGILWVMTYQPLGATVFNWWVATWAGTSTTLTGCTLSTQFSTAQSGRVLVWRFMPTLS